MSSSVVRATALLAAVVATTAFLVRRGHSTTASPAVTAAAFPDAVLAPAASTPGRETAVLAGGCFWGMEGVFEHVKGVLDVVSGYAGGKAMTADYETVSTGTTGHAESVRITFDPSQVSYATLLKIYFSVAHDPTELNRQGPDVGPQYRSEVFATNDEQARVARAYIAQLDSAGVFDAPIVTKVSALDAFYPAEAYHQDYMLHHPDQPYIVFNDRPKVEHLKKDFPALYRAEWPHR
jgi:peptide-methionine (S)-S-oxide reductase